MTMIVCLALNRKNKTSRSACQCQSERKRNVFKGRNGKGTGPSSQAREWHHDEEVRRKIARAQYIKVVQYDLNGNKRATYDSMVDAKWVTGVGRQGLSRCCRFPHRTAGGFRFGYLDTKGAQ
jgi:hypothetical protein